MNARSAAKPTKSRSQAPELFLWRKLSAAKWSDAWMERLDFLGPQRVLIIEFPNAPKVRVEAHALTREEADQLVKQFGGKLSKSKWEDSVEPVKRPPINVRGKLLVLSTEEELSEYEAASPSIPAILIPAGMAFGTGDHATTSTCLRFLADIGKELAGCPWEMLDLGTGSGILAIAARKLGARRAEAGDFDPHAVRTSKENVRVNGTDKVRVKKMDVRSWRPERTWDVVAANLFSGLLVEVAPQIATSVRPGGKVIFSGILREQEAEVVEAFKAQGLVIERVVRKGKWVSGMAARGS